MTTNKHGLTGSRPGGDSPRGFGAWGNLSRLYRIRGDPPIGYCSRGDPPLVFKARGDPPRLQNYKDGPFEDGLVFSDIAGLCRQDGRGMAKVAIFRPVSVRST